MDKVQAAINMDTLIKGLKLSCREFSHLIGVSESTVSYWINGINLPTQKNAWRIIEIASHKGIKIDLGYLYPR